MSKCPVQKPGKSSGVFSTPDNFITATKRRLGIVTFDHDFAADASNSKGDTFFDEEDDALSIPFWGEMLSGGWGWLNPPYKKIAPWAARCAESRFSGNLAFLIPAAVGSNYFRDYIDGKARVLLLNGRLAFMPEQPTWLYPKDCILCLYGPAVVPGYEVWTWKS